MEPREVYIGNGETIIVQPTNIIKEYDWDRLQVILNSVRDIEVGMKEDWYWTAKTLEQSDIDEKKIAGIGGSDWATPSIMVDGVFHDCYKIKE